MKRKILEKEIGDFAMRCLDNESIYDYVSSKEIIANYIEKSNTVDEFVNMVLNDERLQNNQSYWELAKVTQKNYNFLVKQYLNKIADISFVTECDMGSLKVGSDKCNMLLFNGYGDGTNYVFVINKKVNINCLDLKTVVEGNNISIYDYDCNNNVMVKLDGRYGVYGYEYNKKTNKILGDRIFVFVKWE